MEKDDAAQVPPAMHPAHDERVLAGVFGAQFAACVSAAEIAEKVEGDAARRKACLHVQFFCPIF
jgi:hypothetical protein